MSNFRKFISMSAVAVLGVTNLLTPLSYAGAANYGPYDSISFPLTGEATFSFTMPDHDVYLKAITAANKYFVQYSGTTKTDGTMSNKQFTYDQTGTLDTNTYTKLGYTFSGWTTQPNGGGTRYVDGYTGVHNWTTDNNGVVPIYAQWSANSYNITYELSDAGTTSTAVLSEGPTSLSYDETGTVANPTKTGYTFSGWDITNMDGNPHIVGGSESNATGATEVMGTGFKNLRATAGTVKFTAKWKANDNTSYQVKHYLQTLSGTYILTGTDNLAGTTDTEVKPATGSYEGFTEKEGTPTSGNINADGNTVFQYYYDRDSYTLTLNAGRGVASVKGTGTVNTTGASTNSSTNISFKYEEPVELAFTLKAGYTGGKWSGYNNTSASFDMPAQNISKTAYADAIDYTIDYDLKGGTVSSANPTTYTVEEGFTLNNPTRDANSVFAGWTGGIVGGDQLSGPTMTVTIATGSMENRHYTATWTCKSGWKSNSAGTQCIAKDDTEYTVNHEFENLDGTGYDTTPVTQTGTTAGPTDAKSIAHTGFTITSTGSDTIAGDGSTTVAIVYARNSYTGKIEDPTGVSASSITASANGEHPTGTAGTYKYEDTVTLNATLEPGYEFGGWTVTNDETSEEIEVTNSGSLTNATFTMPASSVTITPIVTKTTYKVYIEKHGGIGGTDSGTVYTVESTVTLAKPSRDYSIFVGWSGTDLAETTGNVSFSGRAKDSYYEAIWRCETGYHRVGEDACIANTYTVNEANIDGEHGAADPVVVAYNATGTLPEIPDQSGYNFIGWTVTGLSGGVTHYIGEIPVDEDGNYVYTGTSREFKNLTTEDGGIITFTARWEARDDTPYVINHYYQIGSGNTYTLEETQNLTGTTDKELTLEDLKHNLEGFTYSAGYITGDTTRPTSGAVLTTNIDKYGNRVINLYYTRNINHVYLSGDAHVATLVGSGDYLYGATVTVTATPKAGYHFVRWEKKGTGFVDLP